MSTMNCEIESRSDFLTGSYLVTSISESEVDHHALNTIQTDCPDFILPFSYKRINGQLEFVYKVGVLSKLQYFAGELSQEEYAELWQNLLKPLLECGDWFMHPCSFVLSADYLYYNKSKKNVSYVYIPSICGCSGYDAFREMAVAVSKIMTVSDTVLENKVLRSILEDFNPTEFMKMLKDHISESAETQPLKPDCVQQQEPEESEIQKPKVNREDVLIDISPHIEFAKSKKEKESGGYRIFSSRSKKKQQAHHKLSENVAYSAELKSERSKRVDTNANKKGKSDFTEEQTVQQEPGFGNPAEIIEITQNTPIMSNGPGLRYIGQAHLPPAIQVPITEGEIFTIGRYDVSIGKQQSSFEFDKKTKAISRRHAVIERDLEGYKIVDLSSSAGTFVNEKKLPPNTPYILETGCRVSFGNSGADYVWEVS